MKTAVVSGTTSGVGLGVAEGLVAQGWRVVGLARDPAKAARLIAGVEVIECDLSSASSVRSAASDLIERCPRIDALIGCAGVAPWKRRESADGIELTWATNVLGHALLTELLLDRLKESSPSRVVMISGNTHRSASIRWRDPQFQSGYNALAVGKQAALAKVLWTFALARELEGTGVSVNTFCPAFVKSGLTRDFPRWLSPAVALAHLFAQSPAEGARTPLWLASDPTVEGMTGRFCRHSAPQDVAPSAANQADQDRVLALVRSMNSARP